MSKTPIPAAPTPTPPDRPRSTGDGKAVPGVTAITAARGCGRRGRGRPGEKEPPCGAAGGARCPGGQGRGGLLGLPGLDGAGSAGGSPRTSLRDRDLTGTGKKPRRNSATPRASIRRQEEAKTPERNRILHRRRRSPALPTSPAALRPFTLAPPPSPLLTNQRPPHLPTERYYWLAASQPPSVRGVTTNRK